MNTRMGTVYQQVCAIYAKRTSVLVSAYRQSGKSLLCQRIVSVITAQHPTNNILYFAPSTWNHQRFAIGAQPIGMRLEYPAVQPIEADVTSDGRRINLAGLKKDCFVIIDDMSVVDTLVVYNACKKLFPDTAFLITRTPRSEEDKNALSHLMNTDKFVGFELHAPQQQQAA